MGEVALSKDPITFNGTFKRTQPILSFWESSEQNPVENWYVYEEYIFKSGLKNCTRKPC